MICWKLLLGEVDHFMQIASRVTQFNQVTFWDHNSTHLNILMSLTKSKLNYHFYVNLEEGVSWY